MDRSSAALSVEGVIRHCCSLSLAVLDGFVAFGIFRGRSCDFWNCWDVVTGSVLHWLCCDGTRVFQLSGYLRC